MLLFEFIGQIFKFLPLLAEIVTNLLDILDVLVYIEDLGVQIIYLLVLCRNQFFQLCNHFTQFPLPKHSTV